MTVVASQRASFTTRLSVPAWKRRIDTEGLEIGANTDRGAASLTLFHWGYLLLAWDRKGFSPMAVVISLINMKGGVGKTTIASQLAHAAEADGLRVLAIDLGSAVQP